MRLIGFAIVLLSLAGCKRESAQWYALEGKTMGTTYHVKYFGEKDYQRPIDRLLAEINDAVSTYIPASVISKFNESGKLSIPLGKNGTPVNALHGHFFANLDAAWEVYRESGGYFDPTVGPLVEAWGFGKDRKPEHLIDSSRIDSLLTLVGLQHITVDARKDTIIVSSARKGLRLDFGAIAKGYGVDRVYEFLAAQGITDMFVEIGGEVRTGGQSARGDAWIVGISIPEEEAGLSQFGARVRLAAQAMATSGNYRNVYVLDGRKVWHTINPHTGYPEENDLLSATIVYKNCMIADALATACMVMGVDEAIGLVRKMPGAEGYFIYRDAAGEMASISTGNFASQLIRE